MLIYRFLWYYMKLEKENEIAKEEFNLKLNTETENKTQKKEEEIKENWNEVCESFDDMNLKVEVLRGIYGYGFESPSNIQQKAILPVILGKDVIAQAQSGSGKTGAFVIGTLELIEPCIKEVQVLILAPTRELAEQIFNVYNFIGEFLKIRILNLIGGTKSRENIFELEKGAHVIVGSPGRVLDLMKKGHLKLSYLKNLVLDEADNLLGKGFLENIKDVISLIPPEAKINLFSATMPKEVLDLTDKFMKDPVKILVKNEEVTLEGIKQYYVALKREWKLETIVALYKGLDIAQAIIFCNSIFSAIELTKEMRAYGHMVSTIHSQLVSEERNKVMNEFRSGVTRVLIATDLLARGIDVYNINLVINYDLPKMKETYIHRIGRCGRHGKKGSAINFVLPDEMENLNEIKNFYSTSIQKLPENLSHINSSMN